MLGRCIAIKRLDVWLNIDACGINEGNIDVMIELDLSNLKSLYLGMILVYRDNNQLNKEEVRKVCEK